MGGDKGHMTISYSPLTFSLAKSQSMVETAILK